MYNIPLGQERSLEMDKMIFEALTVNDYNLRLNMLVDLRKAVSDYTDNLASKVRELEEQNVPVIEYLKVRNEYDKYVKLYNKVATYIVKNQFPDPLINSPSSFIHPNQYDYLNQYQNMYWGGFSSPYPQYDDDDDLII